MNEPTIREILRRLDALERSRPRLRIGEVTGVGPLDVALGGADTSYEDVRSVGGAATGNQVAVLVAGNDLLVLGAIGGGVPQARVYSSIALGINTAVGSVLSFDSELFDEGGLHSTSSNTSRLTAPVAGLYAMGACVAWAANATGIRQAHIRLNGTTLIAGESIDIDSSQNHTHNLSTVWRMSAGDYVEVLVAQNSGGSLQVLRSANFSPEFWMHRVG